MMMNLKRNILRVLVVLLTLIIAASLFLYDARLTGYIIANDGHYFYIHAPSWVPYASAILTAVSMLLAAFKKERVKKSWWILSIVALFVYCFSTRTLSLIDTAERVSEYWLGFEVYEQVLPEREGNGYCYEISPLFVHLKPLRHGDGVSFFRGVWPSILSTKDIEEGLSVFGPCTGAH